MPAMTRSVFAALVVIASNALFVADALSATAAAKAKRVLVPIADGTEEIEVVTVVDVLRRAGAEVVLASVEDDDRTAVTCSRGVKIEADCHVKAVTGCAESNFRRPTPSSRWFLRSCVCSMLDFT